jgi:hypothetical protein
MAEPEKSLEKWVPDIATKEALYDALDKAFDYRGDITITLKNGNKIVGYIYNRESTAAEPYIEMFPADKDEKIKVLFKDVSALAFTGVDTAAGKSWAAWVEKYQAKEASGH